MPARSTPSSAATWRAPGRCPDAWLSPDGLLQGGLLLLLGRSAVHVGPGECAAAAGAAEPGQIDSELMGAFPDQRGDRRRRMALPGRFALRRCRWSRRPFWHLVLARGAGRLLCCSRRRGLGDRGQDGADGNGLAHADEELLDGAGAEGLGVDGRLRRVDHRDHVSLVHLVARLDQPFQHGPLVHVRAEGGHAELGHVSPPPRAPPP